MSDLIEGYIGTTTERKKSRLPAKLDYMQSATGLFLALFMWAHMLLVSSILISKDFMYSVTKALEGSFIIEGGHPIFVTIAVAVVFVIFITHAALGMRKLPGNFKQYQVIKAHSKNMKHDDTKLWFIQAFTGFAMFFLGSVHLYIMMSNPGDIGPYASADRVVSDWMWPLYILLLLAVEFHGTIGLYRLCVKWGWFDGANPRETRKSLKKVKWALTVFFLVLGFASLAAYIKIGLEHKANYGERYVPTAKILKIDNNGRLA
ncbi:fumarate reductase cytochrome b subunit [Malaciobacter mytili]|uniref:Fumarate reductase cytochrome b subunit n=1 Tax=Malaciobacter mytili LMG 24559 TaxID=1032238 RepID=A0AAX2AFX4_9BACT|nr:fumarate reductase cytochrome b subunit [Malaciobacter mytili]AXH15882.1 fumarate reductase, cytochrome b subunit [Malaciobacter mytili LMG 24559]RXI46219.1 succinate dehydrogenase/fumarate reductase cytochrome b subunit [Malaciobacter mytili]RXK15902.1 succinate dehydrogenase/fumarate reductase cytochrome b subunit [Malaciobacter mytili LMG 24559]